MPDYQPVTFDAPESAQAQLKELLRTRFKLVPMVADGCALIFQKSAWDKVDRAALADALRAAGFSGAFAPGEPYASRFCSP
jgi:hypothetical protein